jgi:hypothetical protein
MEGDGRHHRIMVPMSGGRGKRVKKFVGGLLLLAVSVGVSPAHAATRAPSTTRHLDMLYVTVTRISRASQIAQHAYFSYSPPSGDIYVRVLFDVVNRNDVQLKFNPANLTVVSPDGRSTWESDTSVPDPDPAILDPGGHARLLVTFQVPTAFRHFELRWSPSPGDYDVHWPNAKWELRY